MGVGAIRCFEFRVREWSSGIPLDEALGMGGDQKIRGYVSKIEGSHGGIVHGFH